MSHKIKKSDNDIALFILSTVFIFFSHFFQKVFHLFTFFVGHPDRRPPQFALIFLFSAISPNPPLHDCLLIRLGV